MSDETSEYSSINDTYDVDVVLKCYLLCLKAMKTEFYLALSDMFGKKENTVILWFVGSFSN